MSDIKLLSCPICSREVHIGTEDYDDSIENVIICDHCNLKFYGSYPATRQALAEEWNMRKPVDKMIDRLREAADKIDCQPHLFKHFVEGAHYSLSKAVDICKEEGVIV